jgi:hypothetical protein
VSITADLDKMIDALEKAGTPAEHVIMGRMYFYEWITEVSRGTGIMFDFKKKKYKFEHRKIPVIVCDSEILEAVPNAKFLLEG